MKTFNELRTINVNEHIERKGQLNYLSWTWAVDTLLQNDPTATWEFPEPKVWNETVMVFCNVTAFGKTMRMQLPVMDNRNNAVKNPDTRKISDATMRCLAKCIACFGIGLYVYAGEDLPSAGEPEPINIEEILEAMNQSKNLEELKLNYVAGVTTCCGNQDALKTLEKTKDELKAKLSQKVSE
jgi:hypothetical protein